MFERSSEYEKSKNQRIDNLRQSVEKDHSSRTTQENKTIKKDGSSNNKWMRHHEDYLERKKEQQSSSQQESPRKQKETRTSCQIKMEKELKECTFSPKTNKAPFAKNQRKNSDECNSGMTLVSMAERAKKWYEEKEKKLSTSRSRLYGVTKNSISPAIDERSKKLVKPIYQDCLESCTYPRESQNLAFQS